jgi:predicted amidohydrolase YtcJ
MASVTLTNARLIGQNGSGLKTVVIRNGKIASVEPATVEQSVASPTDPVDVGGHFVGPSLADAHTHFSAWTLNQSRVNLSSATSAQAAIDIMRQAALDEPGQAPLVGRDLYGDTRLLNGSVSC